MLINRVPVRYVHRPDLSKAKFKVYVVTPRRNAGHGQDAAE